MYTAHATNFAKKIGSDTVHLKNYANSMGMDISHIPLHHQLTVMLFKPAISEKKFL